MKKLTILFTILLFIVGCKADIKDAKEILEKDGFTVIDQSIDTSHLPEDEIPNYRKSMGLPKQEDLKEELLATNRDTSSKETVMQFFQFHKEEEAKSFFRQRLDQYKASFPKDLEEVSNKNSYQRYELEETLSSSSKMSLIIIRKKETVLFVSTLEGRDFANKYIKKFGLHR